MPDRLPIGTVPGLVSGLVAVDILLATLGVAGQVSRVLLRRTNYDDGGATDTSMSADIRNAISGGGQGITVPVADQAQSAVVVGTLDFSATESLYLRVTAADTVSLNLTGWIELTGAAGAVTALTTLAKVKAYLEITGSANDATLNELIADVSARMAAWMRRQILAVTITGEKHDGRADDDRLQLLHHPLAAGTVTVTENGVALIAADFEADDDRGWLYRLDSAGDPIGWPAGRRNVVVNYPAGYDTVPADLTGAATEQTAYVFLRTSEGGKRLGDRGTVIDTAGSATYITSAWAPGVEIAMRPYRDFGVGRAL